MEANAVKMANAVKNAARTWDTEKYFDRSFYSLLETGDRKREERVVVDFVDLCLSDKELQHAANQMSHWIPIEKWKELHCKHKQRNKSLFEEVPNV